MCHFQAVVTINSKSLFTNILQALAAASKTVDFLKIVHSLHSYFLLVGDLDSMNIILVCSCQLPMMLFFPFETQPAVIFICLSLFVTLAVPIIYQVHRIRDGNNFATRRVDAVQKGNIIFILLASFQVFHFVPYKIVDESLCLSATKRE